MKILNKKAFTVIEYTVLFVIIIGAFLIMRNYIQGGIYGLWGQSGKSYAFGRQYDPQKSIECNFDQQSGLWYDANCFQSMVNLVCNSGDTACIETIITGGSCSSSYCSGLN
jgi:hypothetical protein